MRYYISISIRRNLRDSRKAKLYNSKKQARWELAYFFDYFADSEVVSIYGDNYF